jgi:exodeoxyribonuclease VII large subunit
MGLEADDAEPVAVRPALTVSALNRAVAGLLERSFPLVRVRGEVANLTRAASGHWYFSIKDSAAQARCVMFRSRNALLDWLPREGDEVELNASVSLYEARGEFQLCVESLQRAGLGRLYEQFVRTKERLAAEGLFDRLRKRPLPRLPRRIGVVTSLQAAALRDVMTTLARRAPYLEVVVYPVPVQGVGAADAIAAMLAIAARRAEVDVLLLVRGGGSIEDLWSFNEETVARAIAASTLPVIVGVGHESDVTIADFAADLRAATPTAAAELVAPAATALAGEAAERAQRLQRCLIHRLHAAGQRLDYAVRTLATPRAALAALERRLDRLQARSSAMVACAARDARDAWNARREALLRQRPAARLASPALAAAELARHFSRRLQAQRTRHADLSARVAALDPMAVLARGYSIALDAAGRAVNDASALERGARLQLIFARGTAHARVEGVDSGEPKPGAGERTPRGDRIDTPPSSLAEDP